MMIRLNIKTITEFHNIKERLKGVLPIETLNYEKLIEVMALGFNEKTLIKNLRRKKHKTYNHQIDTED